ncbi:bifunctional endoribonuclease/protein kinase ire1 [Podospora bellae-mahoneyi]|uniref:non-specific serine/threonine protein kinase n=1 Tax=Podospora bellae-mahoneyi TaxID=2093777 RepID=A0ABR0FGH1_9PEZI|nr:bifunctional endoribonuclease/protein kinase ire1 [Podospora bellae-mahoneyi]
MLRRPPGQRKYTWATLAVIFLPLLQLADAQQQQSGHDQRQPDRLRSPLEGDHQHVAQNIASTALTAEPLVETPAIHARRKNTVTREPDVLSPSRDTDTNNIYNAHDVRAQAFAPDSSDLSVRAPPPSKDSPNRGAGLSQHIARRLEEWEVEDFVLLATVDGDLYASDRRTGVERWHFKAGSPMIETRHFRTNRSVLDEDFDPIDHYIWVVEPTRDGELYLWRPNEEGTGLAKMPWTMKKVVEDLSPLSDPDEGIMYTGDKKTTMVTFNAATGAIMEEVGSGGVFVNQVDNESCYKPNALTDEDEACHSGTITLGRTEYTVVIHRVGSGPIASLKYSEWGPNTRDRDLIQQNQFSRDQTYITGAPDGRFFGIAYSSKADQLFMSTLDSPIARVFDVLQRGESKPGEKPRRVVLPHPPLPGQQNTGFDDEKVLLNQTGTGSWYAMSKSRYPLISQAPAAQIGKAEWWKAVDRPNEVQMSKALVGVHQVPVPQPGSLPFKDVASLPLLIDAPPKHEGIESPPNMDVPQSLSPAEPASTDILHAAKEQIDKFGNTTVSELFSPQNMFIVLLFLAVYFKDSIRKWFLNGHTSKTHHPEFEVKVLPSPQIEELPTTPEAAAPQAVPVEPSAPKEELETPIVASGGDATPVPVAVPALVEPVALDTSTPTSNPVTDGATVAAETPKKKKAHRGRRGGKKHQKGNGSKEQGDNPGSRDDDPPQESVEEAVNKAKQLRPAPTLEPDILTVSGNTDEVSGSIIRMGGLEVNEADQLGTGSNGTVVFSGKWDGRAVAVKRMLVQFHEIASQETKLLRESDDNYNVIRYFAQQQRASFLYIALELCEASLADVITKPYNHLALARAGEMHMENVLLQIANGISHLHSLRIVHRDLKPQNILVNMGKNGRPRILVSDFGLCKKLEGTQSSFGATTAHAAGTTGWRAPELLIDDDAPPHAHPMALAEPGSSFHSTSNATGPEGTPSSTRRVTRAIDIFSLGLVYYYMLTRGKHPYDCGDRFMREVNIRKGTKSLKDLSVLGDRTAEAEHLIDWMLNPDPKERPTAKQVMGHPFFWDPKKRLDFLCDVSDHFEKEPRDPPSASLVTLEASSKEVIGLGQNFLKKLPQSFVDSLGKQRKYTGDKMLDLLRALRNKKNHYEDMPENVKKMVGSLPEGYMQFWSSRFPMLLLECWHVVWEIGAWEGNRFRRYYEPEVVVP